MTEHTEPSFTVQHGDMMFSPSLTSCWEEEKRQTTATACIINGDVVAMAAAFHTNTHTHTNKQRCVRWQLKRPLGAKTSRPGRGQRVLGGEAVWEGAALT